MKKLVGNLKMNLITPRERESYVNAMRNELRKGLHYGVEYILCPPAFHIEMFLERFDRLALIGAQDVFWERKGSYTGEISPVTLVEFGVGCVIIGHSERRKYLGETEALHRLKILMALEVGLRVIYCIGESQEEHRKEQTHEVLSRQLSEALYDVPGIRLPRLTIAYEPLWSIGTNVTPTPDEIAQAQESIRVSIANIFGKSADQRVDVLYGGSVNSQNIDLVCGVPNMDGVLVGRESLHPQEFLRIAERMGKF